MLDPDPDPDPDPDSLTLTLAPPNLTLTLTLTLTDSDSDCRYVTEDFSRKVRKHREELIKFAKSLRNVEPSAR